MSTEIPANEPPPATQALPGSTGGEPAGTGAGLPAGFLFSQSALQDYHDCRRRFLLRYLLRLSWPAVETEPVQEAESAMRIGSRFHTLAQSAFSGVPLERLEAQIHEPELLGWWQAFAAWSAGLCSLPLLMAEIGLSAPFGDYRLNARFDLLTAAGDGRFTIYDWKTARRRPPRLLLAERLQTRIYPYLLVCAGAALNGGQAIAPDAVEMIYWYPAFPDAPERFPYSQARFAEDHAQLTALRGEIEQRAAELPALRPGAAWIAPTTGWLDTLDASFPRTAQIKRCAFCVYRSLCDRGEAAGDLADAYSDPNEIASGEPPDLPLFIDLEQIAEIAF